MEVQCEFTPAAGEPTLGTSDGDADLKLSAAALMDDISGLPLEMRQFSVD